MKSDYACLGAQAAQFPSNYAGNAPERPLDRIAGHADRVRRLAGMIEDFNDRFFNGAECDTANACTPVAGGHSGELDRLNDEIDRLDSAVQRLGNIG